MMESLDWSKVDGLMPAIVQHALTGEVLMLGYMNEDALRQTLETKRVTFFSRTKQRVWTKGETSGNFLTLVNLCADCDQDTLLVTAIPAGPVCHTGTKTCFTGPQPTLIELEGVIQSRRDADPASSYTASLFELGRDKIAQKVGEESIEVVIASKNDDTPEFLGECADLMYHLTVLLADRGNRWSDVMAVLHQRASAGKKA